MAVSEKSYWAKIPEMMRSLKEGLMLTLRHFVAARHSRKNLSVADANYFKETEGIATIQYPHVVLPVPDNGRYRLHNEIDDCIVCDKCAKICPVNRIDIEPIKAVAEIGKTSDGTPKRIYAAKFDIDMAKCCFCGLCTTVCPTECLTMTKVYDFSTHDIRDHNFAFAEMTPGEIEAKKILLEEQQKQKAGASKVNEPGPVKSSPESTTPAPAARPVFKPRIKPPTPPSE